MEWPQGILIIRHVSGQGFTVQLGFPVIALLVALIAALLFVFVFMRRRRNMQDWHVVEATIKLGNIGDIKIAPSKAVVELAHKAWTELMTRKAGLEFDEKNDVIVEVYNSWYELFKQLRQLCRDAPVGDMPGRQDVLKLIEVLVDTLNLGLRPHLTTWQAKFRRWYIEKEKAYPSLSPQEIQKTYPQYKELVVDLQSVTSELREFSEILWQLAHGGTVKRFTASP